MQYLLSQQEIPLMTSRQNLPQGSFKDEWFWNHEINSLLSVIVNASNTNKQLYQSEMTPRMDLQQNYEESRQKVNSQDLHFKTCDVTHSISGALVEGSAV